MRLRVFEVDAIVDQVMNEFEALKETKFKDWKKNHKQSGAEKEVYSLREKLISNSEEMNQLEIKLKKLKEENCEIKDKINTVIRDNFGSPCVPYMNSWYEDIKGNFTVLNNKLFKDETGFKDINSDDVNRKLVIKSVSKDFNAEKFIKEILKEFK